VPVVDCRYLYFFLTFNNDDEDNIVVIMLQSGYHPTIIVAFS